MYNCIQQFSTRRASWLETSELNHRCAHEAISPLRPERNEAVNLIFQLLLHHQILRSSWKCTCAFISWSPFRRVVGLHGRYMALRSWVPPDRAADEQETGRLRSVIWRFFYNHPASDITEREEEEKKRMFAENKGVFVFLCSTLYMTYLRSGFEFRLIMLHFFRHSKSFLWSQNENKHNFR